MLLFVLAGVLLFRLATVAFDALLFQFPPRITRLEPAPSLPCAESPRDALLSIVGDDFPPQLQGIRV